LASASSMGIAGLRAAPKEDSGTFSAELVLGAPPTLPGQFLSSLEPPASQFVETLQNYSPSLPTPPLSYAEVAAGPSAVLMKAGFIYVRCGGQLPQLELLYSGPYRVLDNGPKTLCVAVGGKKEVIFVDRLKPHLGATRVYRRFRPHRAGRLRDPLPLLQSPPGGEGGACGG
jgi:hypothetical protein